MKEALEPMRYAYLFVANLARRFLHQPEIGQLLAHFLARTVGKQQHKRGIQSTSFWM